MGQLAGSGDVAVESAIRTDQNAGIGGGIPDPTRGAVGQRQARGGFRVEVSVIGAHGHALGQELVVGSVGRTGFANAAGEVVERSGRWAGLAG